MRNSSRLRTFKKRVAFSTLTKFECCLYGANPAEATLSRGHGTLFTTIHSVL